MRTRPSTGVTPPDNTNSTITSGESAEQNEIVAGYVHLERRDDGGQRERDSRQGECGSEHDSEGHTVQVFDVRRNPEDRVVELDAGEQDGEDEQRQVESDRGLSEKADEFLDAVDQQRRPGDEDDDGRNPRHHRFFTTVARLLCEYGRDGQ